MSDATAHRTAQGAAIRAARKARGWSQREAGRHAGTGHDAVSRAERGDAVKPATRHAILVAVGLEKPLVPPPPPAPVRVPRTGPMPRESDPVDCTRGVMVRTLGECMDQYMNATAFGSGGAPHRLPEAIAARDEWRRHPCCRCRVGARRRERYADGEPLGEDR